MIRRIAALLALALAFTATTAVACPGDKMKDDGKADSGQMSPKPKT